jgi:Bacterial Ig-like domain (group 2)
MNWKILALGIPLVTALVACPPPPVTPSYTLAIDPATLTFNKPTTAVQIVNLTITPKDGFSSDLTATLVAPSGSTGITATDITIPAGATTAQLGVVISSTATEAANQAFIVKTSGGGLDPQTQALSITVKAVVTPPTPNFAVTATTPAAVAKPSSGTVTTTSTVTVTPSNGFTGPVVVTATPVTGVSYSALTITIPAGGTAPVNGTLTATVSSTAAVATTPVTVTGTGSIAGASTARTATPVNLVVNATPPPTVTDNVALTPPAGFNGTLLTNTTAQFTAQARNGTTPLAPQPTITWVSSDPTVVSVDATGLATVKKFNTANVTITASVGSVNSTPATITRTYGMEASVGTYNQDDVVLGTAFLIRMRDAAGNIVSGNNATTFKIAGPATWNGGAVADAIGNGDFLWGALDAFAWLRTPPASTATASAPVNGLYTITAPITAAQPYTGKAQLANNTVLLPKPTFTTTEVTGAGASSRTANVTWTAVVGAVSYRVQILRNGTPLNGLPLNNGSGNHQTTFTYSQSVPFTAGDTYSFRVIAYPVDITAADVTLPAQFNISSNEVPATITGI